MRALILGIAGQDGSYLAEQLLEAGHDVHGMTRRPAVRAARVCLHRGDLLDQESLERVLRAARPDVVYNLAAVTSPGGQWGTPQPPLLAEVTGVGVVHLLEAMCRAASEAHLVHASSSAIFEPARYGLYGAAKVLAHQAVVGYRSVLRCSNAILYSHTSPRQDSRFLIRRICSTIARAAAGDSSERLVLGDVGAFRDWGWAPDYMQAVALIGQQDKPQDWVVRSGYSRSVRDVVRRALRLTGLSWDQVVTVDPTAPYVPDEQPPDPAVLSVAELGWIPKTPFPDMIAELLASP